MRGDAMKVWHVDDVMTTDVVVVDRQTPYRDVVDAVMIRRVNAVPVVDSFHRVVGVVSEADLLHKVELAGVPHERRIFEGRRRKNAKLKADALTAHELMTSPAVTVLTTTTIVDAAKTMNSENVKSLPVVNLIGRLIGIISRGDLLKVHLRPDDDIRRDIVDGIFKRILAVPVDAVTVDVNNGAVRIAGKLDRLTTVDIANRMVASVSGVVTVTNELTAPREVSPTAGFPVGVA
jgi:CBS-domain-containing membrane protein